MSDGTGIEWTDETWNPVTGCDKVSPGCAHCYAAGVAARFWAKQYPPMLVETAEGATVRPRQFMDVLCHPERIADPLTWRKPRRVFVNSMSDLFHESVPDDFIDQVFATMALAPQHTFQVLTKRAERMRHYMTRPTSMCSRETTVNGAIWSLLGTRLGSRIKHGGNWRCRWPLPNVWLGVSIENQHFANERIPLLLQTPAAVRFISVEPLIGPVSLVDIPAGVLCPQRPEHRVDVLRAGTWEIRSGLTNAPREFVNHSDMGRIDWVIVGGESGPKARPCHVEWIRSIVRACADAGTPCFVKQLGANPRAEHKCGDCDPCIGGESCYQQYPICMELRDKKGGDMAEWPEDLRVREWPPHETKG